MCLHVTFVGMKKLSSLSQDFLLDSNYYWGSVMKKSFRRHAEKSQSI